LSLSDQQTRNFRPKGQNNSLAGIVSGKTTGRASQSRPPFPLGDSSVLCAKKANQIRKIYALDAFQLTPDTPMLQIRVAAGGGSNMPDRNRRSICSTCYHKVSETAATCPSCGASIKRGKRDLFGMLALAGFWAFNVAMAVWYWNLNGSTAAAGNLGSKPMAAFWPEIGTNQLLVFWLLGAAILGALAYLSRPK
jgi:hypothetical protein